MWLLDVPALVTSAIVIFMGPFVLKRAWQQRPYGITPILYGMNAGLLLALLVLWLTE